MSEHVISCRDIGFHVGCSENTTLDMKLILATWNCKIPTWKWLHDKIYFMSGMCQFHVAEKKFHVAEKVDFPDDHCLGIILKQPRNCARIAVLAVQFHIFDHTKRVEIQKHRLWADVLDVLDSFKFCFCVFLSLQLEFQARCQSVFPAHLGVNKLLRARVVRRCVLGCVLSLRSVFVRSWLFNSF